MNRFWGLLKLGIFDSELSAFHTLLSFLEKQYAFHELDQGFLG